MNLKEVVAWLDLGAGALLEDWGCGFEHEKTKALVVKGAKYVGVDKNADVKPDAVADLVFWRLTRPDAILLKDALHGGEWEQILRNALRSFGSRLAVIVHPEVRGYTDISNLSKQIVPRVKPFGESSLVYMFERRP